MSDLLRVENLRVGLASGGRDLLHDISFTLPCHACLGIVGESGSGKSLTCRALMGLLGGQFTRSGLAWLDGADLLAQDAEAMRRLRGKTIGMILQHPMSAFDPLQTLGSQMVETFRAHLPLNQRDARGMALEMMQRVRLRDVALLFDKYPSQISGGMLQRMMIAIALALEPQLLIADEPTTALDSVTQYDIMEEFRAIRERLGTTMVFISHDFGVVNRIADRVLVMHQGRAVEQGDVRQVLRRPQHQHTRYLVASRQALQQRYQILVNPPHQGPESVSQEQVGEHIG
ncbi:MULTISPECIES: ABC transporter ATP-binding protein [Brenneria]|uniref:ABC transporter ATP-binding protein n=1 Tax=Brenneria nigrifluens DSM 30175 = ATCC 13028 TaxID=1121120 RepID=A0A2U1UP83_9GAMM|nr:MULTISPECIES: ABC transporter ATP-binding protein [Brenneria]EHD23315.1 Nickel-transporting ATPase [Brenneria sp. EniD312]PWC23498.1 ABC transporter ATP-binding protein [Brenneria nigrifluens DSM 30175 = ATCC 13028]QCR06245.1 ABC transporter ATP-binding protein [Brenneria nigrifluens DSM 30175 = ATCC 13028]